MERAGWLRGVCLQCVGCVCVWVSGLVAWDVFMVCGCVERVGWLGRVCLGCVGM